MEESKTQPLLDSSAVAMLLGVVPSAVTNWKNRGNGPLPVPAFTIRKRPYWTPEQIAPIAKEYREAVEINLATMSQAASVFLSGEYKADA